MFNKFIAVALLAVCISAGRVEFENCGNNESAEVTELRVQDCDQMPCVFYRGGTYLIEVDAVARTNSNTLPYVVTAIIIVPIVIESGDACLNLTSGQCPAEAGEAFTYAASFNIDPIYPVVNTAVTATVRDDNNNVVICAKIDIQIRNAPRDELALMAKYFASKNKPFQIAY